MRRRTLFSIGIAAIGILACLVGCGGQEGGRTIVSGPEVSHYYIGDPGNHRVVRFDSFGSDPKTKQFTPAGAEATFDPADFAFESGTGRFFVVDKANAKIWRLEVTSDSDFTVNVLASFGSPGAGVNQFSNPSGIAIDRQGRLYIADSGNHRIVRIDDITGKNWIAFGTQGNGDNQFETPFNVRIDSSQKIWVTDQALNRVVRFDDMLGLHWTTLGTAGIGSSQFNSPSGLDIDFSNKIYVADLGNKRVVRFDKIGGDNWTVYSTGTLGALDAPSNLTVLGRRQVLVTDSSNNRIVRLPDASGTIQAEFTSGLVGPTAIRAH